MHLKRELMWTLGALAILNLSLAFGAIGLFVRMGPAIEQILEENVRSIEAGEQMLAELARAGKASVSAAGRNRITEALARAQRNVTEAEERPVLASLGRGLPGAVEAEPRARDTVVRDVERFISINREAMTRVDLEAQRLGRAGAWAAVLLGFLSFSTSLWVFRRMRRRVLDPLMELLDVLERVRQGTRLRRCRAEDAPLEFAQIAESLNRLLDERLSEQAGRRPRDSAE
jgi:methyl-accepting chemotaxis protein